MSLLGLCAVLMLLVALGSPRAAEPERLELVEVDCGERRLEVREPGQAPIGEGCTERLLALLPVEALAALAAAPVDEPDHVTAPFPVKPGWPFTHADLRTDTLALARLTSDGHLASEFNLVDGTVTALFPTGQRIPGWPALLEVAFASVMPSAAALDGDALDEVLIPLARLNVLSSTGSLLPGWPHAAPFGGGFGSKIFAATRTAPDGPLQVFCSTTGGDLRNNTIVALDIGGNPLPGWPVTAGQYPVMGNIAVGDISGDGLAEVVALVISTGGPIQTQTGVVLAYDRNGVPIPGFPVPMGIDLDEATLGDLDGDGAMEIITGGSLVAAQGAFAGVTAIRGDGTVMPGWPQPTGAGTNFGVALGDVDRDGRLELLASTPNAAAMFSGRVNLWNDDGSPVPGWPILVRDVSFPAPVVMADVSGDGVADILASGARIASPVAGVVYAWEADGTLIPGFPIEIPGRPVFGSAPVVADIDRDGGAELGVMTRASLFSVSPSRVHWFDLGVPYRPEGMEWPTRAHDMARTGAYAPPVRRLGMTARIMPPILAEFLPAPPLRVVVRVSPDEERRPEELFLVAVDGETIEPLQGESVSLPQRRPAGALRQVFRFDEEAVKDLLDGPGLHTLTFRSEVNSLGFGGERFEGEGRVYLVGRPWWWPFTEGARRPGGQASASDVSATRR